MTALRRLWLPLQSLAPQVSATYAFDVFDFLDFFDSCDSPEEDDLEHQTQSGIPHLESKNNVCIYDI
jgi:hypothetical protein